MDDNNVIFVITFINFSCVFDNFVKFESSSSLNNNSSRLFSLCNIIIPFNFLINIINKVRLMIKSLTNIVPTVYDINVSPKLELTDFKIKQMMYIIADVVIINTINDKITNVLFDNAYKLSLKLMYNLPINNKYKTRVLR